MPAHTHAIIFYTLPYLSYPITLKLTYHHIPRPFEQDSIFFTSGDIPVNDSYTYLSNRVRSRQHQQWLVFDCLNTDRILNIAATSQYPQFSRQPTHFEPFTKLCPNCLLPQAPLDLSCYGIPIEATYLNWLIVVVIKTGVREFHYWRGLRLIRLLEMLVGLL